jgi:hypothetical protein
MSILNRDTNRVEKLEGLNDLTSDNVNDFVTVDVQVVNSNYLSDIIQPLVLFDGNKSQTYGNIDTFIHFKSLLSEYEGTINTLTPESSYSTRNFTRNIGRNVSITYNVFNKLGYSPIITSFKLTKQASISGEILQPFQLKGSNDGVSFTDFTFLEEDHGGGTHYMYFDNNTAYKYYQIHIGPNDVRVNNSYGSAQSDNTSFLFKIFEIEFFNIRDPHTNIDYVGRTQQDNVSLNNALTNPDYNPLGMVGELSSPSAFEQIPTKLKLGWNIIAYPGTEEIDVRDFLKRLFPDLDYSKGTDKALAKIINIIKNNIGYFYWPEFNFDGLGNLEPGQGYQIRMKDDSNTFDFDPRKIYTADMASHEGITNVKDYTEKHNNVTTRLKKGWNSIGYNRLKITYDAIHEVMYKSFFPNGSTGHLLNSNRLPYDSTHAHDINPRKLGSTFMSRLGTTSRNPNINIPLIEEGQQFQITLGNSDLTFRPYNDTPVDSSTTTEKNFQIGSTTTETLNNFKDQINQTNIVSAYVNSDETLTLTSIDKGNNQNGIKFRTGSIDTFDRIATPATGSFINPTLNKNNKIRITSDYPSSNTTFEFKAVSQSSGTNYEDDPDNYRFVFDIKYDDEGQINQLGTYSNFRTKFNNTSLGQNYLTFEPSSSLDGNGDPVHHHNVSTKEKSFDVNYDIRVRKNYTRLTTLGGGKPPGNIILGQFSGGSNRWLGSDEDVANQVANKTLINIRMASFMNILKNNIGYFYWPDFNFDGLGTLEPGQGYQIRIKDGGDPRNELNFPIDNFSFVPGDVPDIRPLADGGPR